MLIEDNLGCLRSFLSTFCNNILIDFVRAVNPANYQLITMEPIRVILQVRYFNYLILWTLHQIPQAMKILLQQNFKLMQHYQPHTTQNTIHHYSQPKPPKRHNPEANGEDCDNITGTMLKGLAHRHPRKKPSLSNQNAQWKPVRWMLR
jgi:hypothetical protein